MKIMFGWTGKKMSMTQNILENLGNPHELERLYQKDPEEFGRSFASAWEQNPSSPILAVWNERLSYNSSEPTLKAALLNKDIVIMGVLAVSAGACTRLLFYFVQSNYILPIALIFGFLPFLAAFLVFRRPIKSSILYTLIGSFVVVILFVAFLPNKNTDSILLSQLHLPVFLWTILGLAFTGNDFWQGSARLSYLKFNGDFTVVYGLMAISGVVLTGLTISLFNLVDLQIVDIYMENVVVFGAATLAIVATYLVVNNLALPKNIVPIIAAIFSPLVLSTQITFLVAILWVGKNPFLDRDFLLVFNGVMLIVLVVTIFSITERGKLKGKTISDLINFSLIMLAFLIDSVALSAILFRLSAYGLTPNRLAVLGLNIVVLLHLAWIMFTYFKYLQGKSSITDIQNVVTTYLPVYGTWAALVAFTFPLIFP